MMHKPWHPLFFALAPVLFLYSHNFDEMRAVEAVPAVVFVLFCAILGWAFVYLLIRDNKRSAFLGSAALALFFSFGHISTLLKNEQAENIYLMVLYLMIFMTVFVVIVVFRPKLAAATIFLNSASIVLVVMPLVSAGFDLLADQQASAVRTDAIAASSTTQKPDIYYIILDSYAGGKVLEKNFDYDNAGFYDYLRSKGFYYADKSTSNYTLTLLSVSSALNMDYVQNIDELQGSAMTKKNLEKLIKDSLAFRKLREQGYEVVAFSTGYNGTEITGADKYYNPFTALGEFSDFLVGTTPIPTVMYFIDMDLFSGENLKMIRYVFNVLTEVRKDPRPKAVFAHVLLPHSPYVFSEDGRINSIWEVGHCNSRALMQPSKPGDISYKDDDCRQKYLGQLKFTNVLVTKLLDSLVASSSQVIFLQSDHGPGMEFDLEEGSDDVVFERMHNLNAIYFSDRDYSLLHDSLTPVNNYRLVFKKYFNSDIDLLEDRNYFSSWEDPFSFRDVTEILK